MKARRAWQAIVAGTLGVVLIHLGLWLALDYGPPRLRDPEYGKHLSAARQRAKSDRPLVLVFGSSRVAYGIRPAETDTHPDAPTVANLALVGSGPVMQLMAFRRALADGLNPAAVVMEYWPAFLRQDAGYREEARIDRSRLRPVDEQLIREYFHDPDRTFHHLARDRWLSVSAHRKVLLNQILPRWLPLSVRTDGAWANVDATGWLVGHEAVTPEDLVKARAAATNYYTPLFQGFHVGADSDRAMASLVHEARARGIGVAFLYLPESAEFTALMPPAVQTLAAEHLAHTVKTLQVPLIDARGWVSDEHVPDGFHLLKAGAAEVSRRLGPALLDALSELKP